MQERIPKEDDIYIVVTHTGFEYNTPALDIVSTHNFSFFVGTKKQLEELKLLKSEIVSIRLSPLFLRNELNRFISEHAQRIGGIGYRVYNSIFGKIAETNSYFPKGNVDNLFNVILNSKPNRELLFELKGIGAYLESITANFLHKNYGVEQFRTPEDSSISRMMQLKKGGLKVGSEYDSRIWQRGIGKIIRRRVNIPKRPV